MSSEVPAGWTQSTLGMVSTVKARIGWRGLSAEEYTANGPFLIAGKHIRDGMIDWDSCDHISQFRYDESPEIQLENGDVIFSKDGSIGNPALISDLPGPATINGTMMLVRAQPNHLDPAYLYQVVRGSGFARMIREKVSGSSIPHIFQRDIVHFPVALPPLDEQRRIAAVLRSVDQAIAAATSVKEAAQKVFARVRAELLEDVGQSFDEIVVADAIAKNRGKKVTKLKTSDYQETGSFPIIDQGAAFICGYTDDQSALWPYDLPVIVFGDHTRTLKFVDFPFAIGADGTQCLTPIAGLDVRYFYYALQSLDLRGEGYARHFKLLKERVIPMPDMVTQRRIADQLVALERSIEAEDVAQKKLRETKIALMSDLLSGRVRVPA